MLDNLPLLSVLVLAIVAGAIPSLPPSMRYWVLVIIALTIIVCFGAYLVAPDTLPAILLMSKEDFALVLKNWLNKIFPGGA